MDGMEFVSGVIVIGVMIYFTLMEYMDRGK